MTKLGFSTKGSLHAVIMKEVEAVLLQYHGNKTHAAKHLGIGVRTLRAWVGVLPELSYWRLTRTGLTWDQMRALRDRAPEAHIDFAESGCGCRACFSLWKEAAAKLGKEKP